MPILHRMLVALGIVISLGVVQSGFTIAGLRALTGEIATASSVPVTQVDAARSAWDAFHDASGHLTETLEAIRFRPSFESIAEFRKLADGINTELNRLKATPLAPEAAVLVEDTAKVVGEWQSNALVLLGESPAVTIPAPHVMDRYRTQIKKGLQGLVALALAGAETARVEIEATTATTEAWTIGIAAAALVLGTAIAVPLALGLTRPLARLQKRMLGMIDGDLDGAIADQKRRDEIGRIANALGYFRESLMERARLEGLTADIHRVNEARLRDTEAAFAAAGQEQTALVERLGAAIDAVARGDLTVRLDGDVAPAYRKLQQDFNDAVANLETIVRTVAEASNDIKLGADEIAQASGDLSRRTERQAASLAETAGTLSAIMSNVQRTADGATQVQRAVSAANTEAANSGLVVRQAVEAMGKIEKSSSEISQIIGVIDEIAFQTNLLALNAGVEAARAGEAGRGFAVVASEVRALAQHSAAAAKEIKGLISNARPEVEQGVELVSQTGRALETIGSQIAAVNGVVAEIATSMADQARNLKGVSHSIGEIDQVTQQNAAMVEQSTSATYSLKSRTAELTASVGQFQIGDGIEAAGLVRRVA